jgi:type IV secretory pathway VirB10-like protein
MANENNQESVFSDPEMTQSQADVTQSGVKKNSKSRLIIVIMGAFVLLLLVFGVVSLMGKGKKSTDGGAVPSAPNVSNVPGAPGQDTDYTRLTQEENDRRAQQSGTVIPVLTPEDNNSANDPFRDGAPVTPVVPPVEVPQEVPVQTPPPVEQPPVYQEPQPVAVAPAAPTHSPEQYAAMQTALQSYLQAWQVSPNPSQEFNFNGQEPKPQANVDQATGANSGTMAGTVAGSSGKRGASFVRTGTVIPAMMLGSLNSDAPGPVVAQITTGPLAGSRLIGTFQSTGKKLLINFTTLSRPGLGTFSINAVAIDDNFATGMATDVNNHSFKKFVLPTLAAFIQGYGQAFSRSGSTVVIGPGGSTITQEALTAEQARKAALGEAGSVLTENLLTNADVEPTVKLDCGGGCPVGLLFLSDL